MVALMNMIQSITFNKIFTSRDIHLRRNIYFGGTDGIVREKKKKPQNYFMSSHEVIRKKLTKNAKKIKFDYTWVINETECNKLNDIGTNI